MGPQRFRKKPVVVEAIRYTGDNPDDIRAFMGDHDPNPTNDPRLSIRTLEGSINASPGDWIIRGVQGEFYPCKPDIFEQTYEAVDA